VKVHADEVRLEIRQTEVELPDAVRCVDDRVDAARAGERCNFGDGDDQPGAVTEMRQQHHLDLRVGVEGCTIGVDQRLP
jgi:hypothetical protein